MDYQYAEGIVREGGLNYRVENDGISNDPSAKSGEAIARENELYVLREVRKHGTIREDELAILLGWSKQMLQRTVIRLTNLGKTARTRAHGSYFVSMPKRNASRISNQPKDNPAQLPDKQADQQHMKLEQIKKKLQAIAKIPPSWRHNALSIQVLGELRNLHPKSYIETEPEIHARTQEGKISDGRVFSPWAHVRIETQMTNKTSKPLEKEAREAIVLAQEGITTVFAYFYPPSPYYRFDWEHRLASSIRHILGHDNPVEHIKFLRCHIPKITNFEHCRPTQFEFVELPMRPADSRIGQGKKTLGDEVIGGWHWRRINEYIEGCWRNLILELYYDSHKRCTYKFIEGTDGVPHELHEQRPDGSWIPSSAYPALQAWDAFSDFVACGKENAERLDSVPDVFD